MSDTASSSRPTQRSPNPGDAGGLRAGETPSPQAEVLPIRDDQPTVISKLPPLGAQAPSDSAIRIIQGQILPGDRLGHYELVQYIGAGGMGRVFRAVDTRLARTVALKILPPEQAINEEISLRFQNEAQSAARLDHENIARVHYVGEDRGLQFIAFEFVDGVNIRALVEQKGPLSVAEAVSYVLQVADALTHAASRDVVHRDIKPSNVLITAEGRVKLIDMGLARLRRDDTSAADLTAPGVTLGSFDYISPEQARDPRNADIRSDIYSLGCTFFYMLAGQPPFPEGTVLQKLLQHQGDQPPEIRQFRPELPEEAARVLRKMLAKDPRHRYRSPAELVDELMPLAEQMGLRPLGTGGRVLVAPREPKVSFFERHVPWMAPIAALFCIVAFLNFFWSAGEDPMPRPVASRPVADPPKQQNAEGPGTDGAPASTAAAVNPEGPPGQPNGQGTTAPGERQSPPGPVDTGNSAPKDATGGTKPPGLGPDPPASVPTEEAVGPSGLAVWSHLLAGHVGTDAGSPPGGSGIEVAEGTSPVLSAVSDSESVWARASAASIVVTEPNDVAAARQPVAEPVRSGLLIVNGKSEGENTFPSLAAACSVAADNDVIELRYDGRREERPISMSKLRLTVRAGKGYRPVVVFRPTEADPVKYPRSMFTLTAGRLALVNLAFELRAPRGVPVDNWTLFETRGGQTIRLEKCALSIENASDKLTAYHKEVAFFCAKSAPATGSIVAEEVPSASPPVTIDMADCSVRGEAALLRATQLQPIHLVWNNGLLATSEQLLSAYGGQRPPQPGEMLQIDLRHVTAVVYGGLCRMVDDPVAPYLLAVQIDCSNSILMSLPGVPLFEQVGIATMDDSRQQLAWNGAWNFYEDIDTFWTICDLDGEPLAPPWAFEAWTSYWGSGEHERLDQVRWQGLPKPDRPWHTCTPSDLALGGTAEDNPAIGGASDGSNAGFQTDRLPDFPKPTADQQQAPTEATR
ncbi:MAG: protein kinase [Pirellulales bacterium]|nr:protein kinase [Pirellulales bacterium]